MVAAFRDEPRHPQLPFQDWVQPPNQGSSVPSFAYAKPVGQKPSVQINPRIRPSLARGAIAPPNPVSPYPHSRPAPYAPWVQWLMVGQKGICLLTLTLVGCALALYGQSVYQHRQWGQSYAQLERLQKLEQQGIAASEIMKQFLAEEAERPTSQMTSQMPDKSISLETAPVRLFDDADMPTKAVLDLDLDGPMGY